MIELYDRSTHLFICVVTILPFAFCTLFVRCYVRWTSRTWGVDDWCMLFSAPFFAWLSASCISAAIHGIGAHVQNFHGGLEGQKAALQDFFMFEVSYCLAMLLAKPSIALMLVRIAESKRLYVWILRSVMALQSITLLVVLIYLFAMCKPISYAWDKSIPDGHCASSEIITVFSYVVAGVNVAFDLTCALLPIPLLWNIQLNRNTRVASCILLGFGIFASVCVLVRLKYNIGLSATEDFFYNICPILTYCYAEAGIGMVAANGSVRRPYLSLCHQQNQQTS
ncbi:uncharacterized protein K452DRAFT_269063 [Aplosporella prunicola CBS 121167]|uniref:Rhodopsin domain-containing protein n=1 Tax=Aplosporella prunicola CBS 121167 TaxID=1176127 RepID=A0A6A6BIN2_9PEZI|nr:uncharacterized protein K452DRAFT_269063 [Aplosporella prunicola CBS 121167]KAF2143498.1 hypothetical protein K452DRAFT_269063 [Aplosporella prunicola CBS 121167]